MLIVIQASDKKDYKEFIRIDIGIKE